MGDDSRPVGDGVEAQHAYRPRSRPAVALEGLDGGRLSGTVGAKDGQDLAGVGRERQTVDRGRVAIAHDQIGNVDDPHGRARYRRSG